MLKKIGKTRCASAIGEGDRQANQGLRETLPASTDPDVICAFQQYASADAATAFLQNRSYLAYLGEAEPLLSGPPEITSLSPVWSKADAQQQTAGR